MRKSLFSFFLLAASWIAAQEIATDEGALFADSSQMVDSASMVRTDTASAPGAEKKSVGISGNILALMQGGLMRSYFETPDVAQSSTSGLAVGNAALDVRLLRGYKAYADLEWMHSGSASAGTGASWRVPEMFLDVNIAHKAYFRAGKQVLQWGRGYFFNPTDLINVERKTFFRRIGSREGVFGIKTHIPFGTDVNLYGFVDADGVQRPDSLAGAGKIEFLWGGTEMALMAWKGGDRDPVFGADFSSRVFGWDVTGEAALYPTFTASRFYFQGVTPIFIKEQKDWTPRAAVGLGRSFDMNGIPNRLMTVAEYYYNHPGDARSRVPHPAGFIPGYSPALAMALLAQSGLYEPNSYSRHYAAFFATFARFIRSDISLTFNTIGNFNQKCALISGGMSYRDLNDFSLSLLVNGMAGPDNTEYTFSEQAMQAQIIIEAAF